MINVGRAGAANLDVIQEVETLGVTVEGSQETWEGMAKITLSPRNLQQDPLNGSLNLSTQ